MCTSPNSGRLAFALGGLLMQVLLYMCTYASRDQVAITTLLDCCGFAPPSLESVEDQLERQVRALDMLRILSGKLNATRREVLQRSARRFMTESWGWSEFEARRAATVKLLMALPARVGKTCELQRGRRGHSNGNRTGCR